jgi:hypothetical protein
MITDTYVNSGAAGVRKFLKALRDEFYVKTFNPDQAIKKKIDLLATIQAQELDSAEQENINLATKEDQQGMKLSKLEID